MTKLREYSAVVWDSLKAYSDNRTENSHKFLRHVTVLY